MCAHIKINNRHIRRTPWRHQAAGRLLSPVSHILFIHASLHFSILVFLHACMLYLVSRMPLAISSLLFL